MLAATILGSSMAFIDGTAVNVALPVLQKHLGATVAEVQWVVEAYALFLSSLLLVGGALGDRDESSQADRKAGRCAEAPPRSPGLNPP